MHKAYSTHQEREVTWWEDEAHAQTHFGIKWILGVLKEPEALRGYCDDHLSTKSKVLINLLGPKSRGKSFAVIARKLKFHD
jgi:hypothetical protein